MALMTHEEAKFPGLFDRFFADWPAWFRRPMLAWPEDFASDLIHVDEFTEGNTLVIKAELPGIDPEKDVEILVDDNTLRIEAHRREEEMTEDKKVMRKELRYGSFARVLPLPVGATEADVTATYKDGILEVRVPMLEEVVPEPKKVSVTKT